MVRDKAIGEFDRTGFGRTEMLRNALLRQEMAQAVSTPSPANSKLALSQSPMLFAMATHLQQRKRVF